MNDESLLETLTRRAHEAFKGVPYAQLLGLVLGEVSHGAATVYLEVRDELMQNNRIMHGGATASLIDTAAALAIVPMLAPGETTTTIDLTIHYLRPLVRGRAAARARVIRAGRRVIVVSIDVHDETETIAATALTTYLRLP